jgi:hypothetical protein
MTALAVESVASVMMQDVVGDYEVPDDVPEWLWIQANASYFHRDNGEDGVFEFILNLARSFEEVPAKLEPLLEVARAQGIGYLLFHQGT